MSRNGRDSIIALVAFGAIVSLMLVSLVMAHSASVARQSANERTELVREERIRAEAEASVWLVKAAAAKIRADRENEGKES